MNQPEWIALRTDVEYRIMRARHWLDQNDSLNNTTLAFFALGDCASVGESCLAIMNDLKEVC